MLPGEFWVPPVTVQWLALLRRRLRAGLMGLQSAVQTLQDLEAAGTLPPELSPIRQQMAQEVSRLEESLVHLNGW
jgi:hypothetical protein